MDLAPGFAWPSRAPVNPDNPPHQAHPRVRRPGVRPPQFGLGGSFLPYMESHPLAELVFKDVTAFNAPKIALCRTWKERLDTATLELSNTGITLLSSLLLPALLRQGVKKLSGFAATDLKRLEGEVAAKDLMKTPNHIRLARLGTSFGFFLPFAAAFWAVPFFRNWLTLKRTHSANFESLIGFDGVNSQGPKRSAEEETAFQKRKALQIFVVGATAGLLSLFGFSLAGRQVAKKAESSLGRKLDQWLNRPGSQKAWREFFDKFDLKGKSGNQIAGGPATLLIWGLPAYFGWIHAARSNNERRERMFQMANSLFWFFGAPALTSKLWDKYFMKMAGKAEECTTKWGREFKKSIEENMLPGENFRAKFEDRIKNLSYDDIQHFNGDKNALRKLKNLKYLISGLAVPIASLSLVQLFNFNLTAQKIRNQQAAATTAINCPSASACPPDPNWEPALPHEENVPTPLPPSTLPPSVLSTPPLSSPHASLHALSPSFYPPPRGTAFPLPFPHKFPAVAPMVGNLTIKPFVTPESVLSSAS